MKNASKSLKAFLRGVARVQQTFTLQIGPVRASGLPAVMLGACGILLASGVRSALAKGADRLPETLGEARKLAEAVGAKRLTS